MICDDGGKDFALRDGNKLYFFVHGLHITGDGNVVVERGENNSAGCFTGIPGTIKAIRWTDTDHKLSFTQNGDKLSVNFTHFPYGSDLVVRVAEAELA